MAARPHDPMKLSATTVLTVLAILPVLGLGLHQGQERQEGPLRTGTGGLESGTDADGDRPGDERAGVGNAGALDLDVYGRRSKPRAQTLAERLLGGWRLTEMRLEGVDSRGRIAQGFLHIGPAFLSMELHAAWDASQVLGAIPDSDVHAAFTAEYVIDGAGVLDCSTVIGSFVDEASGLLQWERPAFKRRYLIRENGRQLMLQFGEKGKFSNQLVFEPYLPTARGTRDIFGRPTAGVESGETDIFGRRRPDAGGERDIYGREKPGEPAAPEATAGEGAPGSGNNK